MTANRRRRPSKRPGVRDEGVVNDAGSLQDPAKGRLISDPRTMRALAHPVRLALLETIGREGELTATRAAEMLDESPGNMSWHLQTLAKYGYVEETGGGKGRSRPWRIASVSNRFRTAAEDPEASGRRRRPRIDRGRPGLLASTPVVGQTGLLPLRVARCRVHLGLDRLPDSRGDVRVR